LFYQSQTDYLELVWKGCKMGILRKMGVVLLYFVLAVCVANAADQALVGELNLAEDATARLNVRELLISGNTLVSTSDLLDYMPAVYNASDQPLVRADAQYLYDLTVIRDIVANPGAPREVSIRTIQGLTQYILSVYQKKDYSGIFVYVPEGALTENMQLVNGVLPIIILEAPVTDVRIRYFDVDRNEVEKGHLRRSALESWSPIERNKVASQRALDYLVNLLNLNPDRHVAAVVSRADEPNSLAIEYNIYEASPWHFFIQADNSGTKERQWSPRVGLINTDVLGYDDRFTVLYQATADSTFNENYSAFGSYDFPVAGPRLRLNLYGGYSEFDINPESGPFNFLGSGTFYGAVLRYNLLQDQGWFFDVLGTWSHEESQITPSLFPQFLASDVEMDLGGVGANLYRRGDTANTSLAVNWVGSIGRTVQADFNQARTNAEPEFSILTASGSHSQYLDRQKVQQLRTTVRWIEPGDRLVPAKMTSFGGMYSVRGYDEYEIVADGGILASIQYEYDLIRHGQAVDSPVIANEEVKKLAPLAFFDFGRTTIKDPVVGDPAVHETLSSVGVGVAFEIGNNFSGAVYYGYPLEKTDNTRVGKGRVNASAMLRW